MNMDWPEVRRCRVRMPLWTPTISSTSGCRCSQRETSLAAVAARERKRDVVLFIYPSFIVKHPELN